MSLFATAGFTCARFMEEFYEVNITDLNSKVNLLFKNTDY